MRKILGKIEKRITSLNLKQKMAFLAIPFLGGIFVYLLVCMRIYFETKPFRMYKNGVFPSAFFEALFTLLIIGFFGLGIFSLGLPLIISNRTLVDYLICLSLGIISILYEIVYFKKRKRNAEDTTTMK